VFEEDDEEELPPEIEYADLRRRSLEAAALWVGGVALGIGSGLMEIAIAGVIAAAGALSALLLAAHWHLRLRRRKQPWP
jgi:hypothetical protein